MAMFAGSIAAIFQSNIKRVLAYSSVAQIGYMTLGLSMNNEQALTGGIVHLFNHALMKGGLFLVVSCVVTRIASEALQDMRGLGRQMPLTMAALVLGGLSLIGVPGTVGFVSKWYLVLGALENQQYWIAVLILLSSLLAVIYIWRIDETVFIQPAPEGRDTCEAPLNLLIPTWILIGSTLYFGIFTEVTAGGAARAAQSLMGVLP